jgi:hypothetical protein
MSEEIAIPLSHWEMPSHPHWRAYVDHWERTLRRRMDAEPDPQRRFENFLSECASNAAAFSPRLHLVEQPYLAWAEQVKAIVEIIEKRTRKKIAFEIAYGESDDEHH